MNSKMCSPTVAANYHVDKSGSKKVMRTSAAKPPDNFDIEFFDAGRRFWLGTYDTSKKAARAYDTVAWRTGRLRTELNFPEIETQADAEFLVTEGIYMKEMTKKKMKKRPSIVVDPGDSDESTITRFAREHLEYVQVELRFFCKSEPEHQKKEHEADPLMVTAVETSKEDDEEFWGSSEENDEEYSMLSKEDD
ncbi:AP2-containing protein [Hordeum vulgare]|nr:AP2-containing protein [Hordeum vulgare]